MNINHVISIIKEFTASTDAMFEQSFFGKLIKTHFPHARIINQCSFESDGYTVILYNTIAYSSAFIRKRDLEIYIRQVIPSERITIEVGLESGAWFLGKSGELLHSIIEHSNGELSDEDFDILLFNAELETPHY